MSWNKINWRSVMGKTGLLALIFLCSYSAMAQETADKIIVIIGRNRIILQSDLEVQIAQAKQQNPNFTDSNKCQILQSMIMQKILMEQAERDSVLVNDEDVEGQLDNRLRYFVQMYGSKDKLEQAAGKTIYQLKEEYRDAIREQMIAEKLQNQILENVKITPAETEVFYKKIPVDSLPMFPSTVEVGQIVIDPPVSKEFEDYAKEKLEGIRKQIVDGTRTFEYFVATESQDPGSRDNGGKYDGVTRNGPWAAEFVSAAFKLQNGEISPVFKTKFGYHIVQMMQRKGEEVDVRHILIKPEVTSADFQKSLDRLDSIRKILVAGKMTFNEAVGKYSTDEAAKRTGGMIADPATGTTELDMTKLDPVMVLMLDSLKQGQYSTPHIFVTETHDKSCRIIFLHNRTLPHKANLRDDYSRIQEVAISQKKNAKMVKWVNEKLPGIYLSIAPEYATCSELRNWIAIADRSK